MADFEITIKLDDHSPEIMQALENAIQRGMEACGQVAENTAKNKAPVDSGNLRNSIAHNVKVEATSAEMTVGTNVEYGIYQELGTGKYVAGGRPTPWMYVDDNGEGHWTAGNKARPFIKPAVANNKKTFKNLLHDSLTNA